MGADPLRVRAAVIKVLRVAHGAIVHRRPPVPETVHVDEHRPGRVPNRALVGVDRARVCGPAGSQPPRRNQPVRTRHESPEIVTLCRLEKPACETERATSRESIAALRSAGGLFDERVVQDALERVCALRRDQRHVARNYTHANESSSREAFADFQLGQVKRDCGSYSRDGALGRLT